MNIINKIIIFSLLIFLSFACKKDEDVSISNFSNQNIELKIEKVQQCFKYGCDFIFRDAQEKIVKTSFYNVEDLINSLIKGDKKFMFTVSEVVSSEGDKKSCLIKVYNDNGIIKENYTPVKGDVYSYYHCDTFAYSKSEESDLEVTIKELKNQFNSVIDRFKTWFKTVTKEYTK